MPSRRSPRNPGRTTATRCASPTAITTSARLPRVSTASASKAPTAQLFQPDGFAIMAHSAPVTNTLATISLDVWRP